MAIPTTAEVQGHLSDYSTPLSWRLFRQVGRSPAPGIKAFTSASYHANYSRVELSGGYYVLRGVRAGVTLNRSEMWVEQSVFARAGAEQDWLLRHEQGHLDISRLIARDLCRSMLSLEIDAEVLAALRGTAGSSSQQLLASANAQLRDKVRELGRKADALSNELQTTSIHGVRNDGLYDRDTRHGDFADPPSRIKQQNWNEVFRYAFANDNALAMTMWVFNEITDEQLGRLG